MAAFSRLRTLTAMMEIGLVPVFHQADFPNGRGHCQRLRRRRGHGHGNSPIEGTGPGGSFAICLNTRTTKRPEVILGAGSVMDAQTASLYINAGANFVVGPGFESGSGQGLQPAQSPVHPGLRYGDRNFQGRRDRSGNRQNFFPGVSSARLLSRRCSHRCPGPGSCPPEG